MANSGSTGCLYWRTSLPLRQCRGAPLKRLRGVQLDIIRLIRETAAWGFPCTVRFSFWERDQGICRMAGERDDG